MYDKSDPRSGLRSTEQSDILSRTGLIAEPQLGQFDRTATHLSDEAGLHWFTRAHNFLVNYSEAKEGATFERKHQVDEYCVLLPQYGADITWNGNTTTVPGYSIIFVPPGNSCIEMPDGGELVRIFSTKNRDMIDMCSNANGYDIPRTHIPEFKEWPVPNGGWKVRQYSLDVPPEDGRFGRIFRCTTLMINVLYPYEGPRDPSKMSPHHHDDFEQVSLALKGVFKHFLRWHWTTDMSDWREDQVIEMGSPSVLVIPPPVIHTTQAVGPSTNLLVDIFGPPRLDFSLKPGWVLNAGDYPIPETAE